jgi:hypothetical protein
MTFDDVISGQMAPLGRILRNFRLRMRAPFQGKKKTREMVVHVHAITSVTSGQGRFLSRGAKSDPPEPY